MLGFASGDVVIISPSLSVGWDRTLPTTEPLSNSCHSSRMVAAFKPETRPEAVGRGLVNAPACCWPAKVRARIKVFVDNFMVLPLD